jgi:pimeloyl-ACP methyl ester carboxylesterase
MWSAAPRPHTLRTVDVTTPGRPEPFRLHVPDDVLDDLRARLSRTRLPDEVPESGWAYGTNLEFMRRLIARWRDGFDWRAQEAALNAFDQFNIPTGGVDLHYIHQPGIGPDPMPLLLVHGWPGSVWEFHELIPRLTDPARFGGDPGDAFTVVAPSLPGYTLSFTPGQPRLGIIEIADLFLHLMTDVLGYQRFAAQGGDWGSYIVSRLAHAYPSRLLAIHLNLLPVRQGASVVSEPTAEDEAYAEEIRQWRLEETGYSAIQGTKPQTLAYALTDSPAGLAAWIAEKFRGWTDNDGDPEHAVSLDSLLTNITLYWVTAAIGSSFWPYYDARHAPWLLTERIETPTAYASFPREIRHPPRRLAEETFNIARWTDLPRGGHFAALEVPELLAGDIAAFFRAYRGG